MGRWVAICLLAGCGRLGFDPLATDQDGGLVFADAAADAAADGDVVTPLVFSGITHVAELGADADDEDPTLTADLLEIYFRSDRAGQGDIWVARRLAVGELWIGPMRDDQLSSDFDDQTPEVSIDGLTMTLSSNRNGNYDIFISVRDNRELPWSLPEPMFNLNSGNTDANAAISASNTRVVLHSFRGGGSNDLYEAKRSIENGEWLAPQPIAELNTPADSDINPVLSDNLLDIYWSGEPDGNFDLFTASRPDADSAFGQARPLVELNTPDSDSDPWLSPDGRTIFYSSGPNGAKELYYATR